MAVQPNNNRIARFGVFELDFNTGELRKSGVRLRLQGQPIQVLTLLLERAGDVVTREELRQKLWASDTFVDFDHSLNTAINKVREALGDSASSPRFVETLARRGYRFIAPVQAPVQVSPERAASLTIVQPEEVAAHASTAISAAVSRPEPASPTAPLHPELEVPIPRRGLTRGLFALIQIMYLCFYLAALFRLRDVQRIADSFLPYWGATTLVGAVMITAGVGIPLRCYLLSAIGFDYQRLDEKFRRMFPFVLALDQLWAIAPFLLAEDIGFGAAFAASAGLLYLPFSERTLIRLAYVRPDSAEKQVNGTNLTDSA
ncbi:MAG TPA: winged helix-turn-helix domain-containing protein [Candidatus Sulfotelmatobacter sp.]|nr:winged helix-turn-helix domain-containing protein [Candidatus Sulfotelmatobacter sp.]